MKSETKTCQNCKKSFTIEPEDFEFYKKIDVPPPTWCPECRMVRRMMWRNERSLYRRVCNAPGHSEEIISMFSQNNPFKVYDQKYWWSDGWDPMKYSKEHDFNEPFLLQFKFLFERMPALALANGNAVNTEYANHAEGSKDCYLISAAFRNENVLYSNRVLHTKDSLDLYLVDRLESSYQSTNCGTSYRLFFSYGCEDCSDSWLLYDCRNCQSCFGCVGLRNKSFYIFNKPYSKEEYYKFVRVLETGSWLNLQELQKKHQKLMKDFPRKYMYSFKTTNVVGDIMGETKNCYWCFDMVTVEDCKFLTWGGLGIKDSYDGYGSGATAELLYEIVDTGIGGSRTKFSVVIWGGHDVQYSYNCHGSTNLFGCVGLRNKQYCILNKQYSKEEYEKLAPKIIQHMNDMPYVDKKGRIYKYGEFFPPELSPFAYNETIAQEYFPLTKEQALAQGYRWYDSEAKLREITKKPEDLPDHIKDVEDSITNEVIGCLHEGTCKEQCTAAFKIIPQELQFYKKMNLPLPRLCPNCRHYQRLKQRNPLKLWPRKCTCGGVKSDNNIYQNTSKHFHGSNHCLNEFETSYSSDRTEIVYCEQCYQSEVV